MTEPTAFLTAILPEKGLYCSFGLAGTLKRQLFYNTIPELAAGIAKWEARGQGNVWHACASFTTRSRNKGSVALVRCLWADIEYGPVVDADGAKLHSEPPAHATLVETIVAVRAFCSGYGLPPPLLVHSGHGLHCYWPLSVSLTLAQWEPYAKGLKAAMEAFGLHADPARTADASSILRTPGTTNRKGIPVPVTCGPIVGPYPVESFDVLVDRSVSGSRANRGNHLGPKPPYLNTPTPELDAACAIQREMEVIDFDALLARCAQIRHFKESGGNLSEPLWYAGICTVAHTEGGAERIHEWSSANYPGYSHAETNTRITRARALSGPSTCAFYRSLRPEGCMGCLHEGPTPLSRLKPLLAAQPCAPPTPVLHYACGVEDGSFLEDHEEWVFRNGALFFRSEDLKGRESLSKLTSYPVLVDSVNRGELRTQEHSYALRYYRPHEGWETAEFPAATLAGDAAGAVLAGAGIVVHDKTRFMQYLRDSVDDQHKRRKTTMNYQQFGWKDERTSFLFGDRLYASDSVSTVPIDAKLRDRAKALHPVAGGSVLGWKQAIDGLFGTGSEGMSFIILASFASPLMHFLEDQEGGAIINLMTPNSGTGKTTTLSGAQTVWANDPKELGLITVDTRVAKSLVLAALGNLPCTYDEFDGKDPDVVTDFVVTFTNGRDKRRANNGGELVTEPATWAMLLLAASNKSIIDTILSTGRSDAPAMRVLELPINSSGDLKQDVLLALSKQLRANAGWAGHEYLRYITKPEVNQWIADKLPVLMSEIFTECRFNREHRFWARTLAATACAALIVEKLGLISFNADRIMAWAKQHFTAAARSSRLGGVSDTVETLGQFLRDHLGQTLRMPSRPSQAPSMPLGDAPRHAIYVRTDKDTSTCYISEAQLRKWLEGHANGSYGTLVSDLDKAGILINAKKKVTLGAGSGFHTGSAWCLVFNAGHAAFEGVLEQAETKSNVTKLVKR